MAVGSALVQPGWIGYSALLVVAGALLLRGSRLAMVAAVIAAIVVGMWWSGRAAFTARESGLTSLREQVVALRGIVSSGERCSPVGCAFTVDAREVDSGTGYASTTGRLRVNVPVGRAPEFGRRVWLRGKVEAPRDAVAFPRTAILARAGIFETMRFPIVRSDGLAELTPGRRLEVARLGLEKRLNTLVPGGEGQVAAGLLLGRDVSLDPTVRANLTATGTSHILAVSGFNVALVGAIVLRTSRFLVGGRLALLLACLVVAVYTLLVGAPASAVRAAIMFTAVALSISSGRLADPLTALVVAGTGMALVEPGILHDLGFQLSFAATGGMILFSGTMFSGSGSLRGFIGGLLAMTIAAQIATMPLILSVFHSISVISPVANILVAPVLPALIGSSTAALGLSWLPLLGSVPVAVTWWLSHYVLTVTAALAALPWATVPTGAFGPQWVVAAYGFLLVPFLARWLGRFIRPQRRALFSYVAALVAIVMLGGTFVLAGGRTHSEGELRARFFDIAGDGITIIEVPGGARVVIGSFSTPLAANAVAEQLPLASPKIDLLVLTRLPSPDRQLAGDLTRRLQIAEVVVPSVNAESRADEWLAHFAGRSHRLSEVGSVLDVEFGGDLRMQVERVGGPSEGDNAALVDVVLRFGSGQISVPAAGSPMADSDSEWIVARIAPSLTLTAARLAPVAELEERLLIVGGRPARQATALPHLMLRDDDIVELVTDGQGVLARPLQCRAHHRFCEWPDPDI